jgi:hypothetical protein
MEIVIVQEKDNNHIGNNSPEPQYIKSQGMSQTTIQKPGANNVSQINWDANYNGRVANLNLDVNTNGKKDNFVLQLSKGDLENILGVPSVEKPLEKRLEDDFSVNEIFIPKLQHKPQPYLFRPSIYPKVNIRDSENEHNKNVDGKINNELSKITAQDEDALKSEINNLLQIKKKLQHPYSGKHNHSHYKSHRPQTKTHTPVKRHHLTTKTKKKKNYKTPSPKTIRIHLTEDHNAETSSKRKSSRKKRKTSSPKKDTSFLGRISDLIQN